MNRTAYIAGKMTGLPNYNYPAFYAAEERLKGEGYEVQNPARTDNGSTHKPREFYLREALKMMLLCDFVAVLPGWEDSAGAVMELFVARELGMPVVECETLQPIENIDSLLLASIQRKLAPEPEREQEVESLSCLEEAARVVDGPRRDAYGHPAVNHRRTAQFWSVYKGVEFTAADVCWMMVLQKLSRQMNSHKEDNLVDICGYTRNAQMVKEYESFYGEGE